MHWNIFEEGSNHTLEIQDNTIKTKEEQSSNMGNSDGSNTYQFNLKHRQRLLESFLNNPEGMQKYQILELLLTFVIPQKDLRPVAKKLLKILYLNSAAVNPAGPLRILLKTLLRQFASKSAKKKYC